MLFMLLALVPSLRGSPEAGRIADDATHRFKRIAHLAIGLLLLTGFYNYLWVAGPRLKTAAFAQTYHGVMGAKILLSLVLFTISILLLAPVQSMQAQRAKWLSAGAALGVVIIGLAAYLRGLWQ
jgi:hypothetical protein